MFQNWVILFFKTFLFPRIFLYYTATTAVNIIQQISISKSHHIHRIQIRTTKRHIQRFVWWDQRNAVSSLARYVIYQSQVRQSVSVLITYSLAFLPALLWQLNKLKYGEILYIVLTSQSQSKDTVEHSKYEIKKMVKNLLKHNEISLNNCKQNITFFPFFELPLLNNFFANFLKSIITKMFN